MPSPSILPTRRSLLTLAGSATLLPACSPLVALNAISSSAGSRLAASDVAFGPDPRHRLDIYSPDVSARQAPVMMFIYGGGWDNGSKSDYAFVGHAFASRGFVTVIADYRLVPQVRFPAFVDDGALAVKWVQDTIARHGGDGRTIHLSGHSAGAYNAMMLALDGRFLARAGARRGAIRSVSGLSGPYDFLPFEDRRTIAAFGDFPRPEETQPIRFARRGAPRVFLGTGDQDRTVLPRNSYALADRLKAAGVPTTLKTYPGVGHAGLVLTIASGFRGNAPVLDDIVAFTGL